MSGGTARRYPSSASDARRSSSVKAPRRRASPPTRSRSRRNNSIGSLSFSLVGIVGVLAVVIAGATIWLVLTDPVTVAESVDAGEVSPLIRSLAGAIFDALRGLLKYL